MPGAVTHLNAAYCFKEKYEGTLDLPQFYLGAVCPDAVNVNGHAPKELRWPAHLRNADLKVWENNIIYFYNENYGKIDHSYLLGYVIHIITDIVWDKEYDSALFAVMYKNGVAPNMLKAERWCEIDGYEASQKDSLWLKSVLDDLKVATPIDVGTLSKEDVALWQHGILNKELDESLKPKYINEDLMHLFFESVTKKMMEIVKK